ncbi:hypothetical protein V2J09_014344 [Rumex salicifolius]
MQGQVRLVSRTAISTGSIPLLALSPPPANSPSTATVSSSRVSYSLKYIFITTFSRIVVRYLHNNPNGLLVVRLGGATNLKRDSRCIRAQASNVGLGSSGYDEQGENDGQKMFVPSDENSSPLEKPPNGIPYPLAIAMVLSGCALVFSLIMFVKGGPSSILAAIAKSGFTAAFSLILVSEIGDKTFFIAALLAMQYKKGLVLLGSMAALSLMSILSVIIGRVFNSVPAQFQTTLPIGEYAAVTLLMFFGIKSIRDAWQLPSAVDKTKSKSTADLDEYAEAEELVKEKASKRLSNPLEILWESFSLIFFAEWGDRSMLATIALGAAQSPWGVATGAIGGHFVATSIAVLGGAFLANYISEKLKFFDYLLKSPFSNQVGYTGGVLFLVFAVATFFGIF